ncbi:fast kinase domain-containing protein 3, mitochondrial [Plakobranchus ocellatus]|uniref:Fast kinase domain-containing protein 3, mitochondrial n=1 Tax=Plakobranchus ocellatus TaxID=259542 RepID=A0AAV3Z191_9GAST|nr:fast kinase domain-containing protein 3, mitochondrial [Plakobranchus ocellatus]
MSALQLLQKSSGLTLQSLKNAVPQCVCSAWSHQSQKIGKERFLHMSSGNSKSRSKSKVLSQSSILVQDGIGFEELPILMRRATKDSFPFIPYSYAGASIREESEFDVSFRQALQGCGSVNSVFKLLEIPHNQVEGYSAAFALQRLHELKSLNTEWHEIHSFIRSAVMRELYDRVQSDVKLLASNTLLSLVECYLAAEGFSMSCLDAINEEIQLRLADNAFTITELMNLIELLEENKSAVPKPKPLQLNVDNTTKNSDFVSQTLSALTPDFEPYPDLHAPKTQHFDKFSANENVEIREEIKSKCQELYENVWIHLVSRYSEVDESTLPLVLQALSPSRRSLVPLLEKAAANIWTELTPGGVQACLNSLSRLRVYNSGLMVHLGRWAYVHVHQMDPNLLLSFLDTFTKFCFLDANLMKVVEKCLQLKGTKVQTDVLASSVEYCMSCRYLSPIVLDAAAAHLVEKGDSYQPVQLYAIVRAFGYLNYLPLKPSAFLKKAESCLWNHFDNLPERQILEVLGSLTFVNVLPKNFYSRVTSSYFYTKVGALTNADRVTALMWLRVLKHAVALDLSKDISRNFQWILEQRNTRSVFLYLDSHRVAILAMRAALDELVGSSHNHVLPFYGCCAMYLDKNGIPIEVKKDKTKGYKILGDVDKKLVLMLRSADHFTVNTRQLLGAQAQRKKNLAQMGFTVVEVRASHFFFSDQAAEVLREHLAPHIDLSAMAAARPDTELSSGNKGVRDWLNYGADEAIISDDDESMD